MKTQSAVLGGEEKQNMKEKNFQVMDGNEAVAYVAHATNEVITIYPITPSSPMGEFADAWSSENRPNIWGTVPLVVELQSEGGAAGSLHGSLQAGALSTTFTASQGLLLMIPNMYKIAGELTPSVIHVAARSLAAQALSIFGDHSDVMSVRPTGFALLGSSSVQEAMDFALIAQAATLRSRIPFVHFFDGFRTSHEVAKIEVLSYDVIRSMIDDELVAAHRQRALSPDRPVIRGTAQNPDVYFQGRETVNPFYAACPGIVQKEMDRFAALTGRQYRLFEYYGAKDAEYVTVLMGSGTDTVQETVDFLNARGAKLGVLKVRLYRPFDGAAFLKSLPAGVKVLTVLDRTKEPGSAGEPLYTDCVQALFEGWQTGKSPFSGMPKVVCGRYGLSSKEFTPAMVKSVYDNMAKPAPKDHFTLGILDDVSGTSLDYDPAFSIEADNVFRALFYGLGADGTVGANKNTIKIIGENTENFAQGYFVYDSKKSGAMTISHVRFGPKALRAPYLISQAHFVGCHQPIFVDRYDMLKDMMPGGTFLLNTAHGPSEIWEHLPRLVQEQIVAKKLKFFVIDAYKVAHESGMGLRINTVMQVCFFGISGVLPKEEAIGEIKKSIKKTYGKKGDEIVQMNLNAVDRTLENLFEVKVPERAESQIGMPPPVSGNAPAFVKEVLGAIIRGEGDRLPVSALPVDGTFPTGTCQWEKRNIALEIPVWDPEVCIQCGKCVMICPHAVIRMKVLETSRLDKAPSTFKTADAKDPAWKGMKFSLQVAPEDCTGCGLCVEACPAKNRSEAKLKAINMKPQPPLRDKERENWDFFLSLPEADSRKLNLSVVRQQQLQRPLFEFSGACGGCGETPYVKLLSQLFGDRALIANATGCSSIYGGNLPTTPWCQDAHGRGPAWSNSLFEDNAEFGLGFRLSLDKQLEFARELVRKLAGQIGEDLANPILDAPQKTEAEIFDQRERVARLKQKLQAMHGHPDALRLLASADSLVRKSVWILGGDGWAYDIGFGGLDHVLASGRNVNVLVLDTEVYSNTGGQMSKATPRGAVAKFAAGGKPAPKKDLGLIAMSYGTVYVAKVAMGANDNQTLKAFLEAEAYDGPSLIIAYSHCIAHGINMAVGTRNQKAAVDSGQWILSRYNPDRIQRGENPLQLDSRKPSIPVEQYLLMENRFKMLTKIKPEEAKKLFLDAQADVDARWQYYEYLAQKK